MELLGMKALCGLVGTAHVFLKDINKKVTAILNVYNFIITYYLLTLLYTILHSGRKTIVFDIEYGDFSAYEYNVRHIENIEKL